MLNKKRLRIIWLLINLCVFSCSLGFIYWDYTNKNIFLIVFILTLIILAINYLVYKKLSKKTEEWKINTTTSRAEASEKFIIGLCGRFGAGCTTTAELILSEKEEFVYFSLSKYIKEKAKNEHLGFEAKQEKEKRVILQDIGDALRKNSPSFLVDVILKDVKKALIEKNVIIDSIRNDKEVEALRNVFPNFFLFAIDATTKSRWDRLRKLYAEDKGQFEIDDKRDAGGDDEDKNGQQVKKCMELADVLINNDRDYSEKVEKAGQDPVERYGQKVLSYIDLIKDPGSRAPNWDETCMHHAFSIALRSACKKRQVGAVIIKESKKILPKSNEVYSEKFIIATGCNNVPVGAFPCGSDKVIKECNRDLTKNEYIEDSKYCRKCGVMLNEKSREYKKCEQCGEKIWNIPGKILDLCRAIHAEEAAIIQAAKLGTSIDGAMLYTSTFPCLLCSKKIIGSGIKEIIYLEPYPMQDSLEMLESGGILVRRYEGVNSRAFIRLFLREIEN
ncbi:MAG: deaminase [Candidatus Omnitrophota bacterium]